MYVCRKLTIFLNLLFFFVVRAAHSYLDKRASLFFIKSESKKISSSYRGEIFFFIFRVGVFETGSNEKELKQNERRYIFI